MTSPTTPPPALRPAGLLRRLAAFSYDLLLLVGLIGSLTLAIILARAGREIAPGTAWFELLLLMLAFAFFGWFWTHGGQTLGMRAWRIQVERLDGRALSWRDAALRFLLAALGALALGLGYWSSWFDAGRRCWHDRATGTRVVHRPKH